MSKGLDALQEIKKQVGNIHYFDFSGDIPKQTSYELREMPLFSTIEKELKRLEELEKAFDSLSKENEKVMKELSKEIEKNRAFEIIKKYHITQAFFIFNTTYKSYEVNMSFYEDEEIMSEEEYNLVKEVLVK